MKIFIILVFSGILNNSILAKPFSVKDSPLAKDTVEVKIYNNDFNFQNDTIINDTIIIDSVKFIINTIDRQEFFKSIHNYSGYNNEDIYNSNYKEIFDEKASRKDSSTLIFKLKSRKNFKLCNYFSKNNELGFAVYRYVCHLQSLKSFLVAGLYEEAYGCILIDDSLGTINNKSLLDFISIDPGNKRLITYYWDDWAFTSGGFFLYNIKNGQLKEITSFHIPFNKIGKYNWSLSNVYFTKENEIIFIRQFFRTDTYKTMKCYSKMTIIQ